MIVNRNELKKLIESIHEEDVAEVYDFIGYLNMKRDREALDQIDFDSLSKDEELVTQVQNSREDRTNGLIYNQKQGHRYLQNKIRAFESEQNL